MRVTAIIFLLLASILRDSAAPVRLGNEVLANDGFQQLRGKRIGLLTNPSGVNSRRQTTIDVLRAAKGVNLVALFAGEHGVYGDIPAGKEFKDFTDTRTGLPVYSCYGFGRTRAPTGKALQTIDALVYDLQDTGCRSYTYIATMGMAMESCATNGVEFIVLDRPNPLGGLRVEGPRLAAEFRELHSLVSRWDVPYVYGLTCGELAGMINGERWIAKPAKLSVVRMNGWQRHMTWRDTGLPWTPTSPNIPRADSPLYYTAIGMLGEIGGIQIGTRFQLPFEVVTAPWLDAEKFSRELNGYRLPGVRFNPYTTNYNQNLQQGVKLEFTDPARAPLLEISFVTLDAIKKQSGHDLFAEAIKAGRSFDMFDKVNGTTSTRKILQAAGPAAVVKGWKPGEAEFRKQRQKYLLY